MKKVDREKLNNQKQKVQFKQESQKARNNFKRSHDTVGTLHRRHK